MRPEEIAALSPAAPEEEQPVDDQQLAGDTRLVRQEPGQTTPVRAPAPHGSVSMQREMPKAPPRPEPQTAEDVEACEQVYREIFGPPQSKARRRWLR
jgi:hypothetical protein